MPIFPKSSPQFHIPVWSMEKKEIQKEFLDSVNILHFRPETFSGLRGLHQQQVLIILRVYSTCFAHLHTFAYAVCVSVCMHLHTGKLIYLKLWSMEHTFHITSTFNSLVLSYLSVAHILQSTDHLSYSNHSHSPSFLLFVFL